MGDMDANKEVKPDIDVGDEESLPVSDNTEDEDDKDEETNEVNISANKRNVFGSVLGKGYSFGKRYGSVLGKGFTLGKRFGDGYEFGKIYSNGFDKRTPAKSRWSLDDYMWSNDGIRYDGIKRDSDFDTIGQDFEFVDVDGPVDEKRSVTNDEDDNNRSKRDVRKRRFIQYYGNMLGRGFSLGKRTGEDLDENVDDTYLNPYNSFGGSDGPLDMEKRLYSGILGRGYMFGKRLSHRNRRLFGNWLGRGFVLGKRSYDSDQLDENDGETDNDMAAGKVGSKTPLQDGDNAALQEELSALGNIQTKRYFMSSPGHRFNFGKRFGHILGNGFSFGKRGLFTSQQNKRPYGYSLGRGLSFGKRSPEIVNEIPGMDNRFTSEQLQYNPELRDNEKRTGHILGRGYMFGKRSRKRFGYILGNGFTLGKRDDFGAMDTDDDDINIFIDNDGHMYALAEDVDGSKMFPAELQDDHPNVITCDGEIVPYLSETFSNFKDYFESYMNEVSNQLNSNGQHYFTDGFGNDFIRIEDITGGNIPFKGEDRDVVFYGCFGNERELLDDDQESFDEIIKRNFDQKRASSWKRFGHILGRGFSFGK